MLHNNKLNTSGKSAAISFLLFLVLSFNFCEAQSPGELSELSIDEFLERAIENYPQLKAARLEVESSEALKKTAWDLGQTQVFTAGEEVKNGNGVYTLIGVQQQNIDLLGVAPKMKAQKQQVALAEAALNLNTEQLKREIKSAYGNALVARKKLDLFKRLDSIYTEFEKGAKLRFDVEETSKLSYLAAANQAKKMKLQKEQASYDYASALSRLNLWLVSDSSFAPAEDLPEGWSTPLLPEEEISAHPELKLATERKGLAEANKKAVNAQYFPKFNAQYGSQEILGESGFYQYQVGISIPLFFMQTRGRSQAAQIQTEIANEQLRQKEMELNSRYQSALQEYLKWQNSLNFYRDEALPLAEEQRKGTVLAFGEGAIDYTVFIQNMREAVQVEAQAQEALGNYLNARFQLEYFLSSNNQ